MSISITTREQAKARARAIRAEHADAGTSISHAKALEQVARELGYRDWNTASARLSNQPEAPCQLGDRLSGLYLKQPFEGRVHAIRELAGGMGYEVTLHFDVPVDVVEFESFSGFRQRVTAMVDGHGVSWAKTSDGAPHLILGDILSGTV
ncbi:MAG: glyoxalase superfamily protein [Hyphomonas sp.]|nr:glyoxalase superfamily protein [Hyphomonas sp.]